MPSHAAVTARRVGPSRRFRTVVIGGAPRKGLAVGRSFNTTGPCVASDHYMIPASTRLPEVPDLVANQKYFVVHAPRQTGKTTALRALAAELTTSGRYAALVLSMEAGQGTPTRRWPASSSSTATSRALACLPATL